MLKSRLKLCSTGNFESSCMIMLWFKYSEVYIENLYKNNVIYYYNIWLSWSTCDGMEPPFPCSTFSELLWPWTVVQTPSLVRFSIWACFTILRFRQKAFIPTLTQPWDGGRDPYKACYLSGKTSWGRMVNQWKNVGPNLGALCVVGSKVLQEILSPKAGWEWKHALWILVLRLYTLRYNKNSPIVTWLMKVSL